MISIVSCDLVKGPRLPKTGNSPACSVENTLRVTSYAAPLPHHDGGFSGAAGAPGGKGQGNGLKVRSPSGAPCMNNVHGVARRLRRARAVGAARLSPT